MGEPAAEPIAVIGLDAKFPCDGDTPDKFYEFLVAGRSARKPIPADRYNAEAFWHPDNHRDGTIGGNQAHFIQGNPRAFDAPFFSITPAEAASMDPQQRMLLECVYTAMENAGMTMDTAAGQQIGTYCGSFIYDYRDVLMKDIDVPMMYTGSGTIASTLAGRVNWFYDFRGPALSCDTACSSSMVAFHQAVVGLKARDCDMALACGANLILAPEMGLELNALGVLNPDSVSYSFDERAAGYGRSEGIGAVVLKRMSDALRDGDTIRAVIRNTGSNHDGHSPGLTAPSRDSQVDIMRKTYAQAGLNPAETRFFEAHGTGTLAGDPVEASAIATMFNEYRSPEEPLIIGAVKSNIGHSEGASGITSVIKSILTVERGIIPANHWFEKKNSKILDEWHFHFPTQALPWPKTQNGVRRMSINSFGVSGTNAHVVVEDALHFLQSHGYSAPHYTVKDPQLPYPAIKASEDLSALSPQLFVLSSHDQDGISRLCDAYKKYKPSTADAFYNMSYTMATKRTRFNWRSAIVADSIAALGDCFSEKQPVTRVASDSSLAFIFTGQGAQWARMGMDLMRYHVFRDSVEAGDSYMKSLGCSWSAKEELLKPAQESRLNEAEFAQPLCTILQVALVDLLATWGILPRAVSGHSSGELAAAYSVGAISRESAWKIAYWRGHLSMKLGKAPNQPKLTMAAVGLDYPSAIDAIERVHNAGFQDSQKLSVACMNSKGNHTISGEASQVDALVQLLQAEKTFARKLVVEMAYHSPYMQPMSEEYASCIGKVEPGSWSSDGPAPRFFSSVYGTEIELSKMQDATYWTTNLVSPVRFSESVTAMIQATSTSSAGEGIKLVTDMLEVGPHPALKGPLRNIVDDAGVEGVRYHNVLKRGESDVQSALVSAGTLFARGVQVDVEAVNRVDDVKPTLAIDLPRYAFNHTKEYWCESRLSRNFRNRKFPRHELLGAPVNDWDGKYDAIWRNWIRLSENPWLEHHVISGAILYPAAGMVVMAIEGCRQLAQRDNPDNQIKGFRFREVSFHAALRVPDDAMGIESHVYMRPVKQAARETTASPWREFQVCTAQDDDEWREHCRGQVLIEYEEPRGVVDNGLEEQLLREQCKASIESAKESCTTQVAAKKIYEAWNSVGLAFGSTFQTIANPAINHESGKALGAVKSTVPILKEMMPHKYVQPHLIHPTSLDGTFQVCMTPIISNPNRTQKNPIVLTFLDELWVSGTSHPDEGYLVSAENIPHGRKEYEMSYSAIDANTGEPKLIVHGLVGTEVDGEESSLNSEGDLNHRAWNITWRPDTELICAGDATKAFGTVGSVQKYVDALAHKNPAMKLLEVSADGVDATGRLLSALGQRYLQYDFTNADSGSFAEAKKQISDEKVKFSVLDAKEDPSTQGFEMQTYDTIIAAGGLSLDESIDKVLANVCNLLKSGGKLILATAPGTEQDWGPLLTKSGFAGIDVVLQDASQPVIVTTKPHKKKADSEPSVFGTLYIIYDPASENQTAVAEKLQAAQASHGPVVSCSISQYAELAATTQGFAGNRYIVLPELETGLLTAVDEEVISALRNMSNGKRILWANKDGCPHTDLISGYATSIRLEKLELEFVILTLPSGASAQLVASKILEIDSVLNETQEPIETMYKVIDGIITIPRLVEAPVTKHIKKHTSAAEVSDAEFGADSSRSLSLRIRDIGLLDTLCFDDDPLYALPLGETDVEFETKATAVNFKDLAVMLGKINETPVGLEAAGIVTRVGAGVTRFKPGDKVFGFAFKGAFSTHVRALEGTIAHIPEKLTFADAAVIPIVYTTAYACLYDIGELDKRSKRGKKTTVLIHAAAGGVGQAAIQLAQREGAEIFATVGSLEKRDFLEKTYGLPRDHILSSRDVSFKTGIMRMTKGRGVDIVINSLSGDILRSTWECVAPFGRFAEIGLSDIESRARISMGTFARGARFESIELNYMRLTDMERLEDLFERAMDSVLAQGLKRETPITKYAISGIQSALRFMQSGKHIGKLVIEPHSTDVVPVVKPPKSASKFVADATYVVSGGFGGLGQEIIRWMVSQGARNLIVTSRQGAVDASAKALVADLEEQGIKILGPACDITDQASLLSAIKSCLTEMPPIKGCIQGSTVLKDNTFDKMTLEEWRAAINVKVDGTWNLWQALTAEDVDSKLDFFIMLSSMVSVIGNVGQANYCAGNSFQDALARSLTSQGHNAIALDVPMMNDAGLVAAKPLLMEYLFNIGWSHFSIKDLIATLDYYCRPEGDDYKVNVEDATVLPRAWLPKYSAAEGASQPKWQDEPLFNHLVLHGINGNLEAAKQGSKGAAAAKLSSAKSLKDAEQIVLDALLNKLSKVLSVDLAELDAGRPMHTYGVDSLVAVELRTWMTKEIGADISVFEITSGQRIGQLAAKAAGGSRFVQLSE